MSHPRARRSRFVAFLALVIAATASGAELAVPSQHTTIQAAVAAAAPGDVIVVAPGTYRESIDLLGKRITLRSSHGPAVTILDGAALESSILRAARGESLETVVRGFTFRNGRASRVSACGYPNARLGGAIFLLSSGLSVLDCVFERNGSLDVADDHLVAAGGAVFACNANLAVSDSQFVSNDAVRGGAIDFSGFALNKLTVERSRFTANRASHGGALKADLVSASTLAVSHSRFEGNEASHGGSALLSATENATVAIVGSSFSNGSASFGAGLSLRADHDATIEVSACDFSGHDAGFGAGVFAHAHGDLSHPTGGRIRITACRFLGNVAHAKPNAGIYHDACFTDGLAPTGNGVFYGGGADLRTQTGGEITLTNCLFAGNSGMSGGGAHASSCAGGTIDFINCTVVDNDHHGLDLRFGVPRVAGVDDRIGALRVTNSIVRDNRGGEQISVAQPDPRVSAAVTFSNVQRGFAGQGNIDLEPAFVAADQRDYRLSPGSACIDAGNNAAVSEAVSSDLTGRARFVDDPATRDTGLGQGAIIDLGAAEFIPPTPRRRIARGTR